MPEEFDPYYRWLGIAPAQQPANHYRLLGLELFEADSEVIREAAERQMGHIRRYQLGARSDLSQRILNELGAAKGCLLDPAKKASYDRRLRKQLGASDRNTSPTETEPPEPGEPCSQLTAGPAHFGERIRTSPPVDTAQAITAPLHRQDKLSRSTESLSTESVYGTPRRPALRNRTMVSWAGLGKAIVIRLRQPVWFIPAIALTAVAAIATAAIIGYRFGASNPANPPVASAGKPSREKPVKDQMPSGASPHLSSKPLDEPNLNAPMASAVPHQSVQQTLKPQGELLNTEPERKPIVPKANPAEGVNPLRDSFPDSPEDNPDFESRRSAEIVKKQARVTSEALELPKDVLTRRGLIKQKEYWLLTDYDDLQEHLRRLDKLEEEHKAADLAISKALKNIQELREQLSAALQANEPAVVQAKRRRLLEASAAYRSLLKTAASTWGELAAKLVHLIQRAERLEATYQKLSDDPEVLAALQKIGPPNRLGPTLAFVTNRQRLAAWKDELLTDQTAGFWGDPDGNVFYVPVVVNERAAALFAVQPAAEIILIPASVVQEAGIEVAGEPQFEVTVRGVSFQATKVKMPSLRLGKHVSEDVEAFVVPADVPLGGVLNANAFPRLKLDVQVGQHLLTVRPLPPAM